MAVALHAASPGPLLCPRDGPGDRDGPQAYRVRQSGRRHQATFEPPRCLRLDSERPYEGGSQALRMLAAAIADALAGGDGWEGGRIWRSTLLRVEAEAEGRVSLAGGQLPAECSPELRRALLGPSALDLVLGYVERDGAFSPGLAGLSGPEEAAVRFSLEPSEAGERRSAAEVRDLLDRRRGRRGLPLAIETVEQYLSRAARKLRQLANQVS